MTNKNQVGETVWFYSHSHDKVVSGEILTSNDCSIDLKVKDFGGTFCIPRDTAYDTKAEAVEATRAWAENGIKNLQTILDNLKDDTNQMD